MRGTAGAKKNKKALLFVVSGPSGSGKTTVIGRILRSGQLKNKVSRSISFTTRPMRHKEVDKKDYFFITKQEFVRQKRAKKILEWTKYLGYYYGTPKEYIDKQLTQGNSLILCLDLKGASRVKRLYPKKTVTIFIMPPSFEVLFDRIRNRCSRTRNEEIRKRLKLAKQELVAATRYDYSLVNKNLNRASSQLRAIILKEIRGN